MGEKYHTVGTITTTNINIVQRGQLHLPNTNT
jgi:hypothetical protein